MAGGLNFTQAQDVREAISYSGATRSSNPVVPKDVARLSNRPAMLSTAEKKRQQFKQAIAAGNNARDRFDYEAAFTSYRKASKLFPNDPSSYYGLGNVYFDVFCYGSAIDFYSRAIKLKPNYPDALMQLGYAYLNKEQYEDAEAQFAAILNVNSKNLPAMLARFYVWAKKGKHEQAIEGINKVINEKSTGVKDLALAYIALGNVYVDQKKWSESIEPYKKATQLNPDLAEAFIRLGMSQLVASFSTETSAFDVTLENKEQLIASARQAADTLRTAVDVKHYEHPTGYLMLGMALMYQSNYRSAEDKINLYFSKVKEVEGRLQDLDSKLTEKCDYAFGRLYADGHVNLGLVYEREAKETVTPNVQLLDKAVEQYKEAIAAKQDYAAGYSSLGNIFFLRSMYREAIEAFEKALTYETTNWMKATTYAVLGTSYAQLGSNHKAIDYLNKSIALNPLPSAYWTLVLVNKNQQNYDEAIRLGHKAKELERIPKATSYYLLATAYFSRGQSNGNDSDYEKAIELLNDGIKLNKNFAVLYLSLGNVYKFYKNGTHVDQALDNLNKAKEYDPENPGIYFQIGDLHLSTTRNYDAAIKYLSEAIRLKPDYAMAYWVLAAAYSEKKDYAESIKYLLEGLKYQKEISAYALLADSYERQKNYADAVKVLHEAIRFDPESHLPYLILARVAMRQKKNEEAIGFYEQAGRRLKPNDTANKELYQCRIVRLRRNYTDALNCFQKLIYPLPDRVPYEIGVTHVHSGNKQAALAQHQQLTQLKSGLADDLLQQINEMTTEH
jgi:tetratricopeptide (TPR) repeat protein